MKSILDTINEGWVAKVLIRKENQLDILEYIADLAEENEEIYKKFRKEDVNTVIDHIRQAAQYPIIDKFNR